MICKYCGCNATDDNWISGVIGEVNTKVGTCEICHYKSDRKDYYKVVSHNLKSAWLSSHGDTAQVAIQYQVNQWVKPRKDTQIMVFSDLESAKRWAACTLLNIHKIYKCKIVKSENKTFVYTNPFTILKFLMSENKEKFALANPDRPPINTVFCDSICLTEEINV